MCGIVGYIGPRDATQIIMDGLRRLEYRGYDSAGIAVLQEGCLVVRRDAGKLANLAAILEREPVHGPVGIGHTRWATHGRPSQRNAHPHTDCTGEIVVIHNGIVENFMALKAELQAEGHRFRSDTDTEVIVHLVEKYYQGDIAEAARAAFQRLRGAHAIVVMTSREPDRLVATRIGNAGGVTVGLGDDEMFLASDIPAILEHTRRMVFLEDREMAVVTRSGAQYYRLTGGPVSKTPHTVPYDPVAAAKGEYKHFMQKEIYEQPRAVTDTIRGRMDFETGEVILAEVGVGEDEARALDRVVIVACGTSAYAGLVGKFMLESLAGLPVEVDYGSEFRYRDPHITPRTLVVAITQSGETVDTLAAMDEARRKGAKIVSIVNAVGSMAARVSDGVIYMQAGPEIGVASTKAFTTSLVDLYLLGMYLGQKRGRLDRERSLALAQDLAELPNLMGSVLANGHEYEALAQLYYEKADFLYLGRGINYPIALEGALKLKEISYIHAEGYPAGEMKHGPIALIDDHMPVMIIAIRDRVYEKIMGNVAEVKARNGIVLALGTQGDTHLAEKADHVLYVPPLPELLSPVVTVIPLQLFAYHMAVRRGCDVDQPRNLAKSVTVE
ncbi:MAG: glutamine--fructose-6-phosphate transaminase (isomerizing) [Chloroflexi bacterium]|nr:glutamine--fructose-6-phosphate transaminase (isomerizing) [Chloroflexota bacterium]